MSEPSPLDALLKRLAQGDRDAFTPVFQLLWEPTRVLCTRLLGDGADAADAAQSAMLNILQRANEYDWRRPALPWALGIATWECRTHLKRTSRRRESTDSPPESDGGHAVEEQEQRLLINSALEAMKTLSHADQQTLVETYWETASQVSGATLRKRRERALTRLRDAFRRLYGFD